LFLSLFLHTPPLSWRQASYLSFFPVSLNDLFRAHPSDLFYGRYLFGQWLSLGIGPPPFFRRLSLLSMSSISKNVPLSTPFAGPRSPSWGWFLSVSAEVLLFCTHKTLPPRQTPTSQHFQTRTMPRPTLTPYTSFHSSSPPQTKPYFISGLPSSFSLKQPKASSIYNGDASPFYLDYFLFFSVAPLQTICWSG